MIYFLIATVASFSMFPRIFIAMTQCSVLTPYQRVAMWQQCILPQTHKFQLVRSFTLLGLLEKNQLFLFWLLCFPYIITFTKGGQNQLHLKLATSTSKKDKNEYILCVGFVCSGAPLKYYGNCFVLEQYQTNLVSKTLSLELLQPV